MAETKQVRYGGFFAPPLSDEKLEKYRKMVKGLPTSPVKDAITYIFPGGEIWWDLPEPNGTKTEPHPANPRMLIVSLQEDHKEVLDPHIPWDHELQAIGGIGSNQPGLFNTIEIDAALANSVKCQDWVRQVYSAVISQYYKDPEEYTKIWEAQRTKDSWFYLASDKVKAKFEEELVKAQECCEVIRAAVSTKEHPDVPRPSLKPTPVRDMAYHMLWHTREFDLGREPCTLDKLPPQ